MTKLLSTAHVAERFAVSTSTILRRIRLGRIEAINVGSVDNPRYRIPEDKLSSVVVSSQSRIPEDVEEII